MLPRLTSLLLFSLILAAPAWADESPAAAAQDLGHINGIALACDYREVANRIKYLMIQKSPKTPTFGNAFETATREAFVARTRAEMECPDEPELARQAEAAAERLPAAESK